MYLFSEQREINVAINGFAPKQGKNPDVLKTGEEMFG